MKYLIGLMIALVGTWVLWSWHFTPALLSYGVASCVVVLLIARRMRVVDREGAPIDLLPVLVTYLPWLFWEIAKANVDVARIVLHPRMPISPRLIEVRATQKHDLGRVIYANSITLTPGTVTIDTEGDLITVHALTQGAADGVLSGEMDRRVSRLGSQS